MGCRASSEEKRLKEVKRGLGKLSRALGPGFLCYDPFYDKKEMEDFFEDLHVRKDDPDYCHLIIKETREAVKLFCGESMDPDDFGKMLVEHVWPYDPEVRMSPGEICSALLAVLEGGAFLSTKDKILVTICSHEVDPTDGRLVLNVSEFPGDAYDVSCDARATAGSVAKQIRKERALDKSVQLITSTGALLQENHVLSRSYKDFRMDAPSLWHPKPSNSTPVVSCAMDVRPDISSQSDDRLLARGEDEYFASFIVQELPYSFETGKGLLVLGIEPQSNEV